MEATIPLELQNQEQLAWTRSTTYSDYNTVLGYYEACEALRHCQGDTALDLACGDGYLTQLFRPRFRRMVGVDASVRQLDFARQRLRDVEFHHGLIEELDLAERFDTVFLIGILQHVVDPQVTLRQAASYLGTGGVLIVHVPNANAINRRLAVLMGTLTSCDELSPFDVQVAGRRRSYTMDTVKQELQCAGLRIRATGGVFYKMLSSPQMDWFLQNGPWDEGGFGWGRVVPTRVIGRRSSAVLAMSLAKNDRKTVIFFTLSPTGNGQRRQGGDQWQI